MIQVEINGASRRIAPGSLEQLRAEVLGTLPADHGICQLRVNGEEFSAERWGELELPRVERVELRSAPLRELARGALVETSEWISRICGVLESIAEDYRAGREEGAGERLAEAADALHVLAHLLHGIWAHGGFRGPGAAAAERERVWNEAQRELSAAVDAMASDLSWSDPIALADHTGYALPRALRGFQRLLAEVGA